MTHVEEGALDPGLPAAPVPAHALSPKERLAASRESIRAALAKPRVPDARAMSEPQEPGWLGTLSDALSDLPAAAIAVRWLRRWWDGHPWRTTFEFARDAGAELAGPVAKRHPWWLLIGAFVGGMMLTRVKPWRWLSGGALLAGLLPRFDMASILNWVNLAITDFTRRTDDAAQPAQAHARPPSQAPSQAQAQAQEAPMTAPMPTPPPTTASARGIAPDPTLH